MSVEVAVLGSANLDLGVRVDRFPTPGETILALDQTRGLGGKGVNQAVACQHAGCRTALIAAVGDDAAGTELSAGIASLGVDTAHLRHVAGLSGLAHIAVNSAGENTIVVASGANATMNSLTTADEEVIRSANFLVMQCEVPVSVLSAAAAVARRSGTHVILNAAPAQSLPRDLLAQTSVLIVNEHEARALTGKDRDGDTPLGLAQALAERVPRAVITLGSAGSVWSGDCGQGTLGTPTANVVETTGAGDTFVGYLTAGLAAGFEWLHCLQLATAAGSLAVERAGAVDAIPELEDVEARLLDWLGRPEGRLGHDPDASVMGALSSLDSREVLAGHQPRGPTLRDGADGHSGRSRPQE